MDLSKELMTNRGQVIGFGQVKIPKMPKLDFDLDMPLFSFVVTKGLGERDFIASCIHLQMDGYGDNKDNAVSDMINNIWYFLRDNFKNKQYRNEAWDRLYELSKSNPRTSELWNKYHALQYHFAKKGEPDHYTEMVEKINSLESKVREMEETINDVIDGIDDHDWRILDGIKDRIVVQYQRAERMVAA